jgi:hypothetical protein
MIFFQFSRSRPMRVKQWMIRKPVDLAAAIPEIGAMEASLLLVFGAPPFFSDRTMGASLHEALPNTLLAGCSTAGEITGEGVEDGTCTLTAVRFLQTSLIEASTVLAGMDDSFAAGERIGAQLNVPGLRAILVFGPGLRINGSALVNGIARIVGDQVPITGGLAGDGAAFQQTFTLGKEGISDDTVVAIGLCGDALRFGHGSFGGWEPFGPARRITRCEGNVLYELDGEPALEIYKRYLGEHARELPASGLLFPFALLGGDHAELGLIRTILGIDEASGSLTLAGELTPDGYLRLMHASTDKLVNGAETAARTAAAMGGGQGDNLAILVSCVGRKLVMGGRVDEEVEAVADVFGSRSTLAGFYSYGEISPFAPGSACKLHNQTMTITCLGEE